MSVLVSPLARLVHGHAEVVWPGWVVCLDTRVQVRNGDPQDAARNQRTVRLAETVTRFIGVEMFKDMRRERKRDLCVPKWESSGNVEPRDSPEDPLTVLVVPLSRD